jgi:hypothetical protein
MLTSLGSVCRCGTYDCGTAEWGDGQLWCWLGPAVVPAEPGRCRQQLLPGEQLLALASNVVWMPDMAEGLRVLGMIHRAGVR